MFSGGPGIEINLSFWRVTLTEEFVDELNGLSVQEEEYQESLSLSESDDDCELFNYISSLPEHQGSTFHRYR